MTRTLIVGSGGVGLAYAAQLEGDVTVYCRREEQAQAIRDQGVVLEKGTETLVKRLYATTQPGGTYDTIIVATKTTANNELGTQLPALTHDKTVIVTAQNGLISPALEYMTQRPVIESVVNTGYERLDHTTTKQTTSEKPLYIGRFDGEHEELGLIVAKQLSDNGIQTIAPDHYERYSWRKYMLNGHANAVAAIQGKITGDLKGVGEVFLMEKLLEELYILGAYLKVEFPEMPTVEHVKEDAAQWRDRIKNHKLSMLQDVEAGRETEIEALNGMIRISCMPGYSTQTGGHLIANDMISSIIRAHQRGVELTHPGIVDDLAALNADLAERLYLENGLELCELAKSRIHYNRWIQRKSR